MNISKEQPLVAGPKKAERNYFKQLSDAMVFAQKHALAERTVTPSTGGKRAKNGRTFWVLKVERMERDIQKRQPRMLGQK